MLTSAVFFNYSLPYTGRQDFSLEPRIHASYLSDWPACSRDPLSASQVPKMPNGLPHLLPTQTHDIYVGVEDLSSNPYIFVMPWAQTPDPLSHLLRPFYVHLFPYHVLAQLRILVIFQYPQ